LILDCIKSCQCMNPIFYFDELDKVSTTSRGQEIINLLIHLTDVSQNSSFQDKYYSGIHFDLSKAVFVFSFNILENVNPILRDRMNMIKVAGFDMDAKFEISRKFLIPAIMQEYSVKLEDIGFPDEVINYIVYKVQGEEQGVRNVRRRFEQIISKLNVMRLYIGRSSDKSKASPLKRIKVSDLNFPIKLDVGLVDKLLVIEKDSNRPPEGMYT
jgi:ATP-dependent Lon protease